jgi:hypothetical protein
MRPQLDNEVLEIIKSKYQLMAIISIVDYDTRLQELVDILRNFENAEFENHQRILILHHDTDYYPELHNIGNSIYNLFKIFADFNIPCDKVIFLTNHYGIKDEIIRANNLITNDADPLIVYTSLWYDFPELSTLTDSPKIDYHPVTQLYHCLNGKQRMHRVFLLCSLTHSGLLEQGIVSYHFCS